jgi:hypothetical protein
MVAWDKVASSKALGGLGIPNLRLLNLALRCRWAWLQKVDPSKAWAEFNSQLTHGVDKYKDIKIWTRSQKSCHVKWKL